MIKSILAQYIIHYVLYTHFFLDKFVYKQVTLHAERSRSREGELRDWAEKEKGKNFIRFVVQMFIVELFRRKNRSLTHIKGL